MSGVVASESAQVRRGVSVWQEKVGRARSDRARYRASRLGFTLVELLVVISIIGILVMIMIPASQRGLEAARRLRCKNNLTQLANACEQHLTKHGFYPTGGWGWGWAGDPDQGFTKDQPCGWGYNILPYIEQQALHDLGKGLSQSEKRRLGREVTSTPIALYHCPSRRKAVAYPYVHPHPYTNIEKPDVIGRTDYAINGGDFHPSVGNSECPAAGGIEYGPGSISQGMNPDYWKGSGAKRGCVIRFSTGVSYLRSEVQAAHVRDGQSNTYLIAERYVNPDGMYSGKPADDDQGWNLGYDWDTLRWAHASLQPRRDRPGYNNVLIFGSAHVGGFNAAFCDGSVRTMLYGIDPLIHQYLGNRQDRQVIPGDAF